MTTGQHIAKIWLTNKLSATLVIPIDFARKHGLDTPSHVIVEDSEKGILIRRLKLDDEEK
jgi:hypothetical protein